MIDCATIVVTRQGFEIIAYDESGEVVRESYLRGPEGCDCIGGNFEDEQVFGAKSGLVSALVEMSRPAAELCEQIRKQ